MRIEALERRAVEELGVDPATLIEEYGPHQPVPVVTDPTAEATGADDSGPAAGGDDEPSAPAPTRPYVRAEQEKRLRAAERGLALLGKVNPLALEEYAALEERHQFLTEQLEDLKATRRDLLDIIREVDERVEQVFAAAYADTAREFEGVFARLFPGGEGRLVLTDPSDMLTTGIEVEARPSGQEGQAALVALGGERSLTAVALLSPSSRHAEPVLRHGRGRGRARRHQPRPAARAPGGASGVEPARRDHAPEAHHGDRRRALRRVHAR
jgi:chromosome segregation protein